MSKRDDDSQTDMEVGMTTAERRRRRRRGGGLRVPSDNVPRRTSTPPVVAPVPEDPSLAMSIAYSFTSESTDQLPRVTQETAAPSFENSEAMPTVIDPVSGPVEQSEFEMKTREMTAVDLEALGLTEAGISSTALPVQRLSSPRIEPTTTMPSESFEVKFKKRDATEPVDEVDVDVGMDGLGDGTTLDQDDDDEGHGDASDLREVDSAEFSAIDLVEAEQAAAAAEDFSQLRHPVSEVTQPRAPITPSVPVPPAIPHKVRAQTVALSEEDLEEVREATRLATQPSRPPSISMPPPMPPKSEPRARTAEPVEPWGRPGAVPEIDFLAFEDKATEASGEFELDVDGVVEARRAVTVPEPRTRPPSQPPGPSHPPSTPMHGHATSTPSLPVHGPAASSPPPAHSHPAVIPPPIHIQSTSMHGHPTSTPPPPPVPVHATSIAPPPVPAHPTSIPPSNVQVPRDPPPIAGVREPAREAPHAPPQPVREAPHAPPQLVREAPHAPPPPPPASHKAPPSPPPAKRDKSSVAAITGPSGRHDGKAPRGKPWFVDLFDEDYLRTLPFLTPQATQAEAEFVIDAMGLTPGAQVLDVGCGYGRHAMELAARGFHVVGLDMSTPLLVRGGEEAHRRGLTINFIRGDMRELDFEAQFDGAYCLFSTFGYFDDETNKKTVANIARALKPGGRILVEILNRDYIIADLPTRVWWEGDGCVVLEEVELNYFSSRIQVNRSVVFDDGRQLEQEISVRAYSLHEVGKLLHAAGFRVLEVSGAYHTRGRFFGNQSRHIIVLAERKDPTAT